MCCTVPTDGSCRHSHCCRDLGIPCPCKLHRRFEMLRRLRQVDVHAADDFGVWRRPFTARGCAPTRMKGFHTTQGFALHASGRRSWICMSERSDHTCCSLELAQDSLGGHWFVKLWCVQSRWQPRLQHAAERHDHRHLPGRLPLPRPLRPQGQGAACHNLSALLGPAGSLLRSAGLSSFDACKH